MVGKGKTELFSEKVATGSRTYFFDVKESTDGEKYLVISESRRGITGNYKHNRIMVFQENISAFSKRLDKTIKFMKKT